MSESTVTAATPVSDDKQPSAARLAANRANALKSPGPTSSEGKDIVRLNALKTALTGATVLLHTDDLALYAAHIRGYEKQFEPVGPEEKALVQSIADIRWRLNRIPGLEMAIVGLGRANMEAELGIDHFSPEAVCVTELTIRRAHDKELRNLHLQENRLARRREKEMAELLHLQAERKANEEQALAAAAKEVLLARHRKQELPNPPRVGFEFSKQRFDQYFSRLTPANRQKILTEAIAEAPAAEQTEEAAA